MRKKSLRCPDCGSESVVKKGWNKNGPVEKQIHLCRECGRKFVEKPENRYPGKVPMEAINLYCLGCTMEETKKELRSKFKIRVSKSTIHRWLRKYSHLAPIMKIRENFGPDSIIERDLEIVGEDFHFCVNRYKVSLLDPPPPVVLFLDEIPYRPDSEPEGPESSMVVSVDVSEEGPENHLCRMAALNKGSSKLIRRSHLILERFALINDEATICCDLPLLYGSRKDRCIDCRVDLLRYDGDKVYLVDYLSSSSQSSPESHLVLSAMEFATRTGLPLSFMRCGYFDESLYREFDPSRAELHWY